MHPTRPPARRLSSEEIAGLLGGDLIARLAAVDADGYPHVTPLWFIYENETFYLASDSDMPHVARIRANPRVGLVVDVGSPQRVDGERPNRQVRIVGHAVVTSDDDGSWTTRIWTKYHDAPIDPAWVADRLKGRNRVLITVRPLRIVAVGST